MKVAAQPQAAGVKDLQLLHKVWRPGAARTLRSQNNSPPRPSPFSSRKKKKLLTNRTGWSCQEDGYHTGTPPQWEAGLLLTSSTSPNSLLFAPQVKGRHLGVEGEPGVTFQSSLTAKADSSLCAPISLPRVKAAEMWRWMSPLAWKRGRGRAGAEGQFWDSPNPPGIFSVCVWRSGDMDDWMRTRSRVPGA